MTKEELENRIRKELNLPFYNAKLAEKDYSESEYQQIKADLSKAYIEYIDQYVNYSENDV